MDASWWIIATAAGIIVIGFIAVKLVGWREQRKFEQEARRLDRIAQRTTVDFEQAVARHRATTIGGDGTSGDSPAEPPQSGQGSTKPPQNGSSAAKP